MSNFLEDLRCTIGSLGLADGWSSNLKEVKEVQEEIDSLGENARRMLEVGILQDELVKLGFSSFGLCDYTLADNEGNRIVNVDFVNLIISTPYFSREKHSYSYASHTWQKDVLTKIKELMHKLALFLSSSPIL